MKQIKPLVYKSLTAKQRVIATLAAEARGDEAEIERLCDTCPQYTYRMMDGEYIHTYQTLITIGMTIECDYRGFALGFAVSKWQEHGDSFLFLSKMKTLRDAWREVLTTHSIEYDTMEQVLKPIRNPMVDFCLDAIDTLNALDLHKPMITPDLDDMKQHIDTMNELLGKDF